MSALLHERVEIAAPPAAILAIIEDPAALARVLPGAEQVEATGPGRFSCVISARIQFMTVRAEVDARLSMPDPPRHLRLDLAGRPRGLAGSFEATIPFDLEPVESPAPTYRTAVTYSVDLRMTGRLAGFGAPLMRDTMRRQIAQLVANVEREIMAADLADGTPR